MILTAEEILMAWDELDELGRIDDGMDKMSQEAFAGGSPGVNPVIQEIAARCCIQLVETGILDRRAVEEATTLFSTGLKFGLLIADRAALRRKRSE